MFPSIKCLFFVLFLTEFAFCTIFGERILKIPTYLVVGNGTMDAAEGEWPWLAAVFIRMANTPDTFICGATLISELTLLSAAHCFNLNGKFVALLGRHNISNSSELGWQERNLTTILKHFDYQKNRDSFKSDGDIAILIMDQEVIFTDRIQPIGLPTSKINAFDATGFVVGHGFIDFYQKQKSDTPKQAKMQSVDSKICFESNSDSTTTLFNRSYCAKGNHSAPCKGDSGGGFYIINPSTSRWTILGIVSYSMNNICDLKDYTVFVSVFLFMDWIMENSKGTINSPIYECKNGSVILFPKKCQNETDCLDGDDENTCVWGSLLNLTFVASKLTIIDGPDYTIASKRNISTLSLVIKDSNKVKYLPIRVGETFPNLENYEVKMCLIKNVNRVNFVDLIHLKTINLYSNEIEAITENAFEDLTGLEKINLGINHIKVLPDKVFINNINLQEILLRENKITFLSEKTFMNLTKLLVIDLKHNLLTTLRSEFFTDCKNLKKVFLLNNKLTKVEVDTFSTMNNLQILDIRCNECYDKRFVHSNHSISDAFNEIAKNCSASNC